MASHHIVCGNQYPVDQPTTHAHLVRVGLRGNSSKTYSRILSLAEVLRWMDAGETFYTVSPSSAKIAQVVEVACSVCKERIIRSAADAVSDNNLDNLSSCD
ncbi:MAG: DUF3892 domain-containing protein [Actinomycetota bacterium]|nr:DUF3892 domain-containing protein [Actinomycetota bacterium]